MLGLLNLLVPDESRSTLASNDWNVAYNYIQWYFRISHPYMTLDAPGDPPRSTHQETLTGEQGRSNMLFLCVSYMSSYHGYCACGYRQRSLFRRILSEGHHRCHYGGDMVGTAVHKAT